MQRPKLKILKRNQLQIYEVIYSSLSLSAYLINHWLCGFFYLQDFLKNMLRCPRPRPRGFYLLAPQPSLRSGSARSKNSLRPAQRKCVIIAKNFKKAISLAKAPSHEKHFAPLDVRGLWHARPPPSILPFTSHGLRPRTTK